MTLLGTLPGADGKSIQRRGMRVAQACLLLVG
jgi:hypothetical protein